MTASRFVLAAGIALLAAAPAFGHGGTYRGPGTEVPPDSRVPTDPPPPSHACDCLRIGCATCTRGATVEGRDLALREQETTELRRWKDVVRVRITTRFRANAGLRSTEGYAPVAHGPLLAIVGAKIAHIGEGAPSAPLAAKLRESSEARRDYRTVRDKALDPLLLSPVEDGSFELRAAPIRPDWETTVEVEAYALADGTPRTARLYRTGDRYLVVAPLDDAVACSRAALVDDAHERIVAFLDGAEAERLYPARSRDAVRVPCVPELERALLRKSVTQWVAVEEPAEPPRAPLTQVPPPSRDPAPPPPAPEPETTTPAVAEPTN